MSFSSGILTARSFAISGADSRSGSRDRRCRTQVSQLVGAVGVAFMLIFATGPLAPASSRRLPQQQPSKAT